MTFKSTFSRIAGSFATPARAEVERAYLERSVSRIDLERRQREIDHGKFRDL